MPSDAQHLTVGQVYGENRHIFGIVPDVELPFVCEYCLGPVDPNYSSCFACHELFDRGGAPRQLAQSVVPITSALNPSSWYARLATYKRGNTQHMPLLPTLTYRYLNAHDAKFASMLGGQTDFLTIVPSKRGSDYSSQPLRKALAMVEPLKKQLTQTMTFDASHPIRRREYQPAAFPADRTVVNGARIVLVEDTWVTGATAVSAAGSLLDAGAAGVVILPIARCVDDTYWPQDHPYRVFIDGEHDISHWPRGG